MGFDIDRPKLEGNIAIDNDRQIGFAEFGIPGAAVFWLHGTPGPAARSPQRHGSPRPARTSG